MSNDLEQKLRDAMDRQWDVGIGGREGLLDLLRTAARTALEHAAEIADEYVYEGRHAMSEFGPWGAHGALINVPHAIRAAARALGEP